MRHMKMALGAALACGWWLSGCATEPPKSAIESPTVAANVVPIVATVEQVDEKNRVLALRNASGETRTMSVDPAVANLDRIARGDRVAAVYLESVVVQLQAPGLVGGSESMGTPTVQQRATVEDIDPSARILTLRLSDGSLRAIRVAPQIGSLDKVHKGDVVVVRYTQAVVVCVSKIE